MLFGWHTVQFWAGILRGLLVATRSRASLMLVGWLGLPTNALENELADAVRSSSRQAPADFPNGTMLCAVGSGEMAAANRAKCVFRTADCWLQGPTLFVFIASVAASVRDRMTDLCENELTPIAVSKS